MNDPRVMIRRTGRLALTLALSIGAPSLVHAGGAVTPDDAAAALKRAARYFREHVSTRGGYLWEYSADLSERRGEGNASPTQIWVQPPGTPSVGMAFLRAHERTGDAYYLDAARDAAHALVWGQLASGGWAYSINFDPDRAGRFFYRRDVEAGQTDPGHRDNTTTFDDDNSQSALRLLMLYDRATRFEDEAVHQAAGYALKHFLQAQYPSGGWPQRYVVPCDPAAWPVKPARYPESWPRTHPKPDYKFFYTLNDATIPDMIATMLLAYEAYGERAHLESAMKGGDFLILAQMPDPQPAWAQQYDAAMTPVWARRFEPPAIASRESVSAIRALMQLHVQTGEARFLGPISRALAWFERSRLPDGRHARFYELETNRPIYFTTKYELVYTDDDLPTHYAFKTTVNLAKLREDLEQIERSRKQFLERKQREEQGTQGEGVHRPRKSPPPAVIEVLEALDDQGRWVEDGRVQSETFIRNVDIISAYLANP